MSENMQMMMEIGFNVFYLIFIWTLVIRMYLSKSYDPYRDRGAGRLFRLGFLLLAIGDTGHVGFRVWAYLLGSLDATVRIAGLEIPLVGAGALSTAVLVTFLYLLMAEAERRRFNQPFNLLYLILFLSGIARFVIMALPGNDWGSSVPPAEMSLYRNIPLTVLGLGLAIIMLIHARKKRDKFFTYLSILIFISFAFYAPVILFVQKVPMIGMLMIPKTIAYLLMAWAVYRSYFRRY